ncbi:acyl-CoA synthetase [Roseomonas fluvialis]|uniref:Long-chain-fatty-acid--CoA ligase n=1 Tax=Roseomonas fluvialis TaxID=1750527 RepID=A0ABN6P7V3_9PROT|nr:acyl-CoA synthetase [Roseomonas fluvialis]
MRPWRIPDAVRELGRADPAAIAIIDAGREVPCSEFDQMARRMAAWLERQGLRPGDRVGITIRGNIDHLATTLALMRLGCDQIGLASHDTPAMRADLAQRVGAVAVIGDQAEDAVGSLGLLIPDHAAIAADPALDDSHIPTPGPDGTTVLIPSSGTTGRPKIIPMTERLLTLRGLARPQATARRCSAITAEFAQSRWSVLTAIAAGSCWAFHAPAKGPPLVDLVRRHGIEIVVLAPSRAEALLQEVPRMGGWPAGVALNLTGTAVPGALRARIQAELTRNLHVLYGATECGVVAIALPEDHARHPDGVGRAWSASAIIVDEAGRRLPPGTPGVLRILSAGRADGYLDDPAATAAAFLPGGWYHTGDIATLTPDGHVLFGGRGDDMMILGTINIFPTEIEGAALGFPGLADCAAFALPSAAHGDLPVLAVVEAAPGRLDTAALLAHCRARLGLRAPRKIVLVPAVPRNGVGKVLRHELAALAGRA